MKMAIIGGGAAGCFAAIQIKDRQPDAEVHVWEAGRKALAKVAVTGGGRCNVTNSFREVDSIERVYPRGSRLMKRLLRAFSHEDTYRWFETNGVRLVTQDDQCVFPQSQDALEIVDTLLSLMRSKGVRLHTGCRVASLTQGEEGFTLHFAQNLRAPEHADRVLVTTGGSPQGKGLSLFANLQIETVAPVPSLYGLCLPGHPLTQFTGMVIPHVCIGIAGTKHRAQGPLLITHWGLSGPAILKLSAYAARHLHEAGFRAPLTINWMGTEHEEETTGMLMQMATEYPQRQIANVYPPHLGSRLWLYLLSRSGLNPSRRWAEVGRKGLHRLASTLTCHTVEANGKNRHKEEFVTCGGVALTNINPSTLECRTHPGLYFAGEVLDVDAITGGFNLQAAWTMGYVAAKHIGMEESSKVAKK